MKSIKRILILILLLFIVLVPKLIDFTVSNHYLSTGKSKVLQENLYKENSQVMDDFILSEIKNGKNISEKMFKLSEKDESIIKIELDEEASMSKNSLSLGYVDKSRNLQVFSDGKINDQMIKEKILKLEMHNKINEDTYMSKVLFDSSGNQYIAFYFIYESKIFISCLDLNFIRTEMNNQRHKIKKINEESLLKTGSNLFDKSLNFSYYVPLSFDGGYFIDFQEKEDFNFEDRLKIASSEKYMIEMHSKKLGFSDDEALFYNDFLLLKIILFCISMVISLILVVYFVDGFKNANNSSDINSFLGMNIILLIYLLIYLLLYF